MSTLANYCANDELYNAGSFLKHPLDLGLLYPISPNVDVYYPPNKRARVSSRFLFSEFEFKLSNQASIEILPDECLFEILRRLPGNRERNVSACVSKRWLKVLTNIRKSEFRISEDVERISSEDDDNGDLTRCLEGTKATDLTLAAISVGTTSQGGLGKLSIRGSNFVTDLGVSAIARACPSLRTLSLWNVPSVGDNGLLEIARECRTLEKLDLSHCPLISNKGLIAIAQNCPNLTALNLESCSKVGNEVLLAIGKCCRKLESISIKDCPLVGDLGVSSLVSSASPALTKVKLQDLNITDFSLAVIGYYGKNITSLALSNLRNVTEKGFWVMGNAQGLQKLTSLGVASCRGITDLSLETIGNGCKTLKHICLRKCCFVTDDGLIAFSKVTVTLESLQLEECNGITQTGIIGVLTNPGAKLKCLSLAKCSGLKDLAVEPQVMPSSGNSLRSLSVRSCPGFGSAGLCILGNLCPQLQHLDLSGLYGITDSGALPLIQNNEAGLIKVNLSRCFNLTNEVVFSLVKLHGKTLEVLNLEGCRRIADASLAAIAENCMFLSDLDVSKCGITDSGIAALSRGEKKLSLQVLSLSGCSEVSNKSLSFLKKLGRTLLGLNIQGCDLISSRTIELLKESLWKCDILS